jgi:hypothetical protein
MACKNVRDDDTCDHDREPCEDGCYTHGLLSCYELKIESFESAQNSNEK